MSYQARLRPHIYGKDGIVKDIVFDWKSFSVWLSAKYVPHYADVLLCYAKKYVDMFFDAKEISLVPESNRNNVIKALIVLSKFLGCYEQFSHELKNCGVQCHKQSSIESFLRILKASDSDILDWYVKAYSSVRDNEKLYLEFMKVSGVRCTEGILAFNKIIELAKDGKLNECYEKNLGCLMHFKYPKLFIRGKKNVYISFVPESLIYRIASSQSLTYVTIRKRLNRYKLTMRLSELRDYFGSYLLQHGILEQEVNLLQGRIPVSVFIRHYWSPKLEELDKRVFKALETLDSEALKQPIVTTA